MTLRNNDGTFKRIRKIWDSTDWNDGYYDNKSRFRVYRPDYPRAYPEGYALRYHVVWWLAHNEPHPVGTILHHINHIKDDDRLENLALMQHGEHTRHHCRRSGVEFVCEKCGNKFIIPRWRVDERRKSGLQIKYCSQVCYQEQRRV